MKKTFGVLIVCIFFAVVAHAEEPQKKEDVSMWEKIRNKIEKITPKQKPTVTTAVGGVRGAKTDGHELYWKGEEKAQAAMSSEEIDLFSSALQLAESGAAAEATSAFNDFLAKFPESLLVGDAQNALAELAKEHISPQVPQAAPQESQEPQDFAPPELPGFELGM